MAIGRVYINTEFLNQRKIYGFEVDETNSNPETSIKYVGDAVGMKPAKMTEEGFDWGDWERFFKNISYPVVLKSGEEQYRLDYNDRTKKIDGSDSNLSGQDGNVMTFIKHIWRKFERTNTGYRIYLSTSYFNGATCLTKKLEDGYNINNFAILTTLQDLFLLIFKNRNSKETLGYGYYTETEDFAKTGGTDNKGYIYGVNKDVGEQVCFLGIEDLWGNKAEFIDGLVSDDDYNLRIGYKNFNNDGEGYEKINTNIESRKEGFITKVIGNNAGYIPEKFEGSWSSYYCDYGYLDKNSNALFGGMFSIYYEGLFSLIIANDIFKPSYESARLTYKNKKGIYVGCYLGTLQGSRLASISGKIPNGSFGIALFRNAALGNN